MTVDAQGNNLAAVGIPIGGFAAVQFSSPFTLLSSPVTTAAAAAAAGYQVLGLFTEDGGPTDASTAGSAITFFQDDYELHGVDTLAKTIKFAERNQHLRRLLHGVAPGPDGKIRVKQLFGDDRFPLLIVTFYKNGTSVVENGWATISAVSHDQRTRGSVEGSAITFKWQRDEDDAKYSEWYLGDDSQAGTVWGVVVGGTPTGGTFSLVVNGVSTAPIAYNETAANIAAAINALSGVTGISGVTGSGATSLTFPSAVVLTADAAGLTGGSSPSVTVTKTS